MPAVAGRPKNLSQGISRSGDTGPPASGMSPQKSASAFSAPCRPSFGSPCASTAAFIAPAEVPEMPSKASRPSSRIASSTPQVKAPCAPPPCSARLTVLVFRAAVPPSPIAVHSAVQPPSIVTAAPVTDLPCSPARNSA